MRWPSSSPGECDARKLKWYARGPVAIKAGLSPEIVADLKARKRPANMKEDEAAVYDFVIELFATHEVSDETFARARQVLGEQQVVDLTAVTGTYVAVAMILAMAEEAVPQGKEPPFKPGDP
jgi:4-carboxymuconolactone decarboxylase